MQPNVSQSVEVVSWEEENADVVIVDPEAIVVNPDAVIEEEVRIVIADKTPGMAVRAAITAVFVAVDAGALYAGTVVDWAFLHRWTLMLIGIATGIAWTLAVVPRKVRA